MQILFLRVMVSPVRVRPKLLRHLGPRKIGTRQEGSDRQVCSQNPSPDRFSNSNDVFLKVLEAQDLGARKKYPMLFRDRIDAGQRLSSRLKEFANRDDVLVLALPRGGVPIGFSVSRALNVPLDILVVRKLGVPGHEELAMGAIAFGGVQVLNPDIIQATDISPEQIEEVAARELLELKRREHLYRGDRKRLEICGKIILIVDDGMATGSSMRAAIASLRHKGARQIVSAIPVAAQSVCALVDAEADSAVCLFTPVDFYAVGRWYRNFSQMTDQEVRELLDHSMRQVPCCKAKLQPIAAEIDTRIGQLE
jgi:putative phosphoribosyl transferase